jgi:ATP-dependent Lon protease
MPGRGRMTVTGNLKEVMKESISAAASYVRARALNFGVKPPVFEKTDIHVHVPDGATPKDGPSAGVAMTVALLSLVSGVSVANDVAMTGEITLSGQVLPVGGLKEKSLAAQRAGIKRVIAPARNEGEILEIPEHERSELEFVYAEQIGDAVAAAFGGKLG